MKVLPHITSAAAPSTEKIISRDTMDFGRIKLPNLTNLRHNAHSSNLLR